MATNESEEIMRLRAQDEKLRSENTHLRTVLKEVQVTNTVLKQRPAQLDILSMSYLPLPAELRDMVRLEALTMKVPVAAGHLEAFLQQESISVANDIRQPGPLRMRHFKAFLQINTINLHALKTVAPRIVELDQDSKNGRSLSNCVRSLRIHITDILLSCLHFNFSVSGSGVFGGPDSLLTTCENLQQLTIAVDWDFEDIGRESVDWLVSEMDCSGFYDALRALKSLSIVRLNAAIDCVHWQSSSPGNRQARSETNIQFANRSLATFFAPCTDAVLLSNPQCRIKEEVKLA